MNFNRSIDDVVRALKRANDERINVNFLIGAGCSVTANIPTASGFVNEIKEKYYEEYERTQEKNYANCMSMLTPPERRNLISSIVKSAKINWAHISIAQLLKNNNINRVLTTNFDNLILRACAVVGEFPAIYDLTTSETFRPDLLFDKSVIHLHGQHTGFILCNTQKEMHEQLEKIKGVYLELNKNSMWIIIGYSGENDPVFQLLTNENSFENRLFIVGNKDREPSQRFLELLGEQKYSFYVKGYDADDFLVNLSRRLSCFPPTFVHKPFTYLSDTLNTFASYKIAAKSNSPDSPIYNEDLVITTKNFIDQAINTIEKDELLMATNYFHAGLYEEVIKLGGNESSITLIYLISRAHRKLGDEVNVLAALNKMKIVNQSEPNNEKYIMELCMIYFERFMGDDETLFEKETFNLLIEALDFYENSFNIVISEESQEFIAFFWLQLIQSVVKDSGDETINIIEFENRIERHVEKAATYNDSLKYYYKMWIHFSYFLTERGKYEFSYRYLKLEYNDKENDLYYFANMGFWHFRNTQIDIVTSEENGVKHYEKSIDIALRNEDEILNPLKQKYYYELARFYFYRKVDSDTSKKYCNIAYEFGEFDKYIEYFQEIVSLLYKIENISADEEVAITE